jgi:hypothetical protein
MYDKIKDNNNDIERKKITHLTNTNISRAANVGKQH